jgi:putative transposase
MGRHARLVVPEVALHAVQRGNNRQDCFHHENDRLVYLSILKDAADLRQCAIHAYCLMTNHVHLLFTPPYQEACSLMMRDLGREYAAYFNRRYTRTGSLWERPFKSCLVDSASHVLACYRYIERNPVRAHMVAQPCDHRWSSYAGNAALREDRLLTSHPEYAALGLDAASRWRSYQRLLADADESIFLSAMREATHAGYPLIGERLKAELEKQGVRLARSKPGPRAEPAAAHDGKSGELALTE